MLTQAKQGIFALHYDEDSDIISIKFSETKGLLGRDIDSNATIFFDEANNKLASIIILDFMEIISCEQERIAKYESITGLDFKRDILPQIQ